jgi:hypothetical protein
VLAVYTFAGWTVFVWATRARNIAEDGGSTLNLVVALGLAALGVAVAVAARRGGLAPVLAVAVGATVVAWAVRVPQILLDPQHGLAFQAVHAALAAVSVGLAAAAWRTTGFWPARRRGSRAVSQGSTSG